MIVLVLSRKEAEGLWIGDVRIVVQAISGNRVSLAVDAPPGVRVLRDEVRRREQAQASARSAEAVPVEGAA
jgi:carbon storage regulator CsrA